MIGARLLLGCALMAPLAAGKAQAPGLSPLEFLHTNGVVVFQGDSITDGGRQRNGSDYNHIMGQDYAYMLAGEIGAVYPERRLNFINRGIGGDRVKDLAARWRTDTLELKPNVLSILVGVNDTFFAGEPAETPAQYEAIFDRLLADTLAALPGVKIVLGQPFVLPVRAFATDYAAKRAELQKRQAVVEILATKYHLPVVRYQEVFDAACNRAPAERWSWDGVHPTYAGHWLMAQAWLQTTEAAWGGVKKQG